MLALLKLIPFKDWCYLAFIVGLLTAFASWSIHERHIQAAKDAATDAALAKAQIAQSIKVETHADQQVTAAVKTYDQAVATPVPLVNIPRIVCSATITPAAVPGDGSPTGRSDGTTRVPEESTVPFNPAPAIAADGRDADAQVKLLQAYIQSCVDAGICKAK